MASLKNARGFARDFLKQSVQRFRPAAVESIPPKTTTSMDLEELEEMRTTLLFEELISFAQLGDYGLFLPNAATQTQTFLNWRPHEMINPIDFIKRRSEGDLLDRWKPQKNPERLKADCRAYLTRIFDHLETAGLSAGCLDVGGYLGLYSVFVGVLARRRGMDLAIRCYEPGPTQNLIVANADINGLGQRFELRRAAVSDVTGPILYKYTGGKTLSGGLSRVGKTFSRLCYATTVDREIEDAFPDLDCVLMKLDVEGFEPETFRGLQKYKDKVAIIVCELQPWAQDKAVGERTFRQMLEEDYLLLEIGNSMWPHHYIAVNPSDMDDYYEEIRTRAGGISDVIMISKSYPGAKALFDELSSIDPHDRTVS